MIHLALLLSAVVQADEGYVGLVLRDIQGGDHAVVSWIMPGPMEGEGLTCPAFDLARPDLECAIPALRWLSGTARPGGDPTAWRQWMAARARAREPGVNEPDLRLPSGSADPADTSARAFARTGLGLATTNTED